MHTDTKHVCQEAKLYCDLGHQKEARKLLELVQGEFREDKQFKKVLARASRQPSRMGRAFGRMADSVWCVLSVPIMTIVFVTVAYWLKDLLLV